jgi:hypothetical protein
MAQVALSAEQQDVTLVLWDEVLAVLDPARARPVAA